MKSVFSIEDMFKVPGLIARPCLIDNTVQPSSIFGLLVFVYIEGNTSTLFEPISDSGRICIHAHTCMHSSTSMVQVGTYTKINTPYKERRRQVLLSLLSFHH